MQSGRVRYSIKTKMAAAMTAMLVGFGLLLSSNIYTLESIDDDFNAASLTGKGRIGYHVLYLAGRIANASGETRARIADELRAIMDRGEEDLNVLISGDRAAGIPPETSRRVLDNLNERLRLLRIEIRPEIDRLLKQSWDGPAVDLLQLDASMNRFAALTEAGIDIRNQAVSTRIRQARAIELAFAVAVLGILLAVFATVHGISRRARALARTADLISGGEFDMVAPANGADELAELGRSFNTMTGRLRDIIKTEQSGRTELEKLLTAIAETINNLSAASAEILAATSQQAAGMEQQSAAITETVSTVDEVLQTANQAAERAKVVAASSQHAVETSLAGRKAVDATIATMEAAREQTGAIAESIMNLAEQAQAIGEIINAVNDVAEQTNMLALNAAIEASRAGEHGKGFTIVATEIKDLADQSKRATLQVRHILGDIQRATNKSVIATEEGTRSADQAINSVNEAGSTIKVLADTIAEAARAAAQIAASAGQQSTGMTQIQQAMVHINQASSQNLAATRQSEQAAQNLNALGVRLKELLAGYGR